MMNEVGEIQLKSMINRTQAPAQEAILPPEFFL